MGLMHGKPQDRASTVTPLKIPGVEATLEGDLGLPEDAAGVVVFAHGSGSGRHSARNQQVAEALRSAGMGTLLMDLLTPEEEAEEDRGVAMRRFDIPMLAERLLHAIGFLSADPRTSGPRIGLFGASTGAGAALIAAAARPDAVWGVVSRGGRPDLAREALGRVRAPTLLIVGGADEPVIQRNEQAMAELRCEKRLVVIPGATHLFSEPGALEEVAHLAADWFDACFARAEM